jgi:SET domain-containing protein
MTLSVASSYRSPKTRVLSSKTHGRGLFATKRIPKGEIVSVRGGHILTRPMLKQRRIPPGYWGYTIADGFVLGPLTKRETESVMMFLNHSCEPNVGIQGQIVFVAMRDIRVGEELTIDYAMFGGDTKPMRCRCGAAACRKVITRADWRLKVLQKKYAGYFSWQIVQRLARPCPCPLSSPVRSRFRLTNLHFDF